MNKLYLLFALGTSAVQGATDLGDLRSFSNSDMTYSEDCSSWEDCRMKQFMNAGFQEYFPCAKYIESDVEDAAMALCMCKYLQMACPMDDYYEQCKSYFLKCTDDADPVTCIKGLCPDPYGEFYCAEGAAEQALSDAMQTMQDHDYGDDVKEFNIVWFGGMDADGDSVMATTTVLLGFCNTDLYFFNDEDAEKFSATAQLLSGSDCSEMGEPFDLSLGCYSAEDSGDCGAKATITYEGMGVATWIFSSENAVNVAVSSFALLLLGSTAF